MLLWGMHYNNVQVCVCVPDSKSVLYEYVYWMYSELVNILPSPDLLVAPGFC